MGRFHSYIFGESKAKGLERRLVGFQVEGRYRSKWLQTDQPSSGQSKVTISSLNVPIGLAYMDEVESGRHRYRSNHAEARTARLFRYPSCLQGSDVVVTK